MSSSTRRTQRARRQPRRTRPAAPHTRIPVALMGVCTAIEYIHASDGERYRHDFTRKGKTSQTRLYVTREGDQLILSPTKVRDGFIQH